MHKQKPRSVRGWIGAVLLLMAGATATAATSSGNAPSISGLWDATVGYGDIQVPFKFGIAQTASGVSGWFFNGDELISSDSGHFESGHLILDFPSYGRRVDVQLSADGSLSGSYGPAAPGSPLRTYPFSARRASTARSASSASFCAVATLQAPQMRMQTSPTTLATL